MSTTTITPPPGFAAPFSSNGKQMPLLAPQTTLNRPGTADSSRSQLKRDFKRSVPSAQPLLPQSSARSTSARNSNDRYSKQNVDSNRSSGAGKDANAVSDSAVVRSASGARYDESAGPQPTVVNSHQSTNTSSNHKYDIPYLLSLRDTNAPVITNILAEVSRLSTGGGNSNNSTASSRWSNTPADHHTIRVIGHSEPRQRNNSQRGDDGGGSRRWVDDERDRWRERNDSRQTDQPTNRRHNALPKTYDENAAIEWADEVPNTDFNFDFSSAVLDRTKDKQQARKMGITILDQTDKPADDFSAFGGGSIQTVDDIEAERAAFKAKMAADKQREIDEIRAELAEVHLDTTPAPPAHVPANNTPAPPNNKLANFLFMGGEDSKFGAFSNAFNKSSGVPVSQPVQQSPPVQQQPAAAPVKMGADAFFKMFSGPTAGATPQQSNTMPSASPILQYPQSKAAAPTTHVAPQQIQQQYSQPPHQQYSSAPTSTLQQQRQQHQQNVQHNPGHHQQQMQPTPQQSYHPQQLQQPLNGPPPGMQSAKEQADDGDAMNRLLNKARARKQQVQPNQPTMTPAAAVQRMPVAYSNLPPATGQQYSMPYQQGSPSPSVYTGQTGRYSYNAAQYGAPPMQYNTAANNMQAAPYNQYANQPPQQQYNERVQAYPSLSEVQQQQQQHGRQQRNQPAQPR